MDTQRAERINVEFDQESRVWEAAASKDTRPILQQVLLRYVKGQWWLIATDGFVLAMVPATVTRERSDESAGAVMPERTFLIEQGTLQAAQKNGGKFTILYEPGKTDLDFGYDSGGKYVQANACWVQVGRKMWQQEESYTIYPDFSPILPTPASLNGESKPEPVFDFRLLTQVMKATGAYYAKGNNYVAMAQHKKDEPIVVWNAYKGEPYQGETAVIMPVQLGNGRW